MPESDLLISQMSQEDAALAIEWARREGWNPGLHDAALFYSADPNGFFKGVLNGEIVAVGSAVTYGANFAFCGLYIVAPEHRGQGYGLELTRARLAYCGDRNVGIDGVLENVGIYQNIGYIPYYENHRYQFEAAPLSYDESNLVTLDNLDFEDIDRYDQQCFPAIRSDFLYNWIHQPDSRFLACVDDGELRGFVLRRRCVDGHKIGPLFADNADIADQLLRSIQSDIIGEAVLLDVPEINSPALDIAKHYNKKKVFATARMYQKEQPVMADEKVFGITTFELG
jgi:GNAT superfamily N-acetyltransferase